MQLSELFIQVTGNLTEQKKQQLETDLKNIKGVLAARFNKKQEGRVLILFDAAHLTDTQLLDAINQLGYNTQTDADL